jgi:hypothetical protein
LCGRGGTQIAVRLAHIIGGHVLAASAHHHLAALHRRISVGQSAAMSKNCSTGTMTVRKLPPRMTRSAGARTTRGRCPR